MMGLPAALSLLVSNLLHNGHHQSNNSNTNYITNSDPLMHKPSQIHLGDYLLVKFNVA